jgi:hypothetical protein
LSKFRKRLWPCSILVAAALIMFVPLGDGPAQVSFPLRAGGTVAHSPPFHGRDGRYLIQLEMNLIRDRHYTSCLLGGDNRGVGSEPCNIAPAILLHWTLVGDNGIAAQHGPSPAQDIEQWAREDQHRRVSRELGLVDLRRGATYTLAVQTTGKSPLLAGANPIIKVSPYYPDGKGLDGLIIRLIISSLLAMVGLVWLSVPGRPESAGPDSLRVH